MSELVDFREAKHALDLCDMWQGRALREAKGSKLGLVCCSAFDHYYGTEHLLVLLRCVFPEFRELATPFLFTCGKVALNGNIIADVVTEVETLASGVRIPKKIEKNIRMFHSMTDLQSDFRRLADKTKCTDDERREMFVVAKRWVVCDYRIDPNLNPNDPGARRVH